MEVSIFAIGWLFGFACGVAILALHGTSKDLEHEKQIVRQLEFRDQEIDRQRRIIAELKKGARNG